MRARLTAALVAFGLAVTLLTPAPAAEPASPNVVELFTSQSCSSCPPAEAYLGTLAGRADLIALEYHVDYWNDLVHGAAGRWADVHSNPAYTARQRSYAARLPSSLGGGVYTPQMVIDGRTQAIGSRAPDVEAALRRARQSPRLTVRLATSDAGKTELSIGGAEGVAERSAGLWLVRFKVAEETKVRAGENRGKTLINHHIVTGPPTFLGALGPALLDGETMILGAFTRASDEGCAILVQAGNGGPILGAARCPALPAKAS